MGRALKARLEAERELAALRATHLREMREMDHAVARERDRRYAEVDVEREKALKIKELADDRALGLAREIQVYKDEKANELRTQIERERGNYATQADLRAAVEQINTKLEPVSNYVVAQQGGPRAITGASMVGAIGAIAGIVAIATGVLVVVAR